MSATSAEAVIKRSPDEFANHAGSLPVADRIRSNDNR
jgi:hypothetical protein